MFNITKTGDTPSQHPYSEYSKILVRDGYNRDSSGKNRKEDYEAEYFEYEKDSRARIIALLQRKTETETTPRQALVASWPNSGIGQGSTCLVPPEQNDHFTFSFWGKTIIAF